MKLRWVRGKKKKKICFPSPTVAMWNFSRKWVSSLEASFSRAGNDPEITFLQLHLLPSSLSRATSLNTPGYHWTATPLPLAWMPYKAPDLPAGQLPQVQLPGCLSHCSPPKAVWVPSLYHKHVFMLIWMNLQLNWFLVFPELNAEKCNQYLWINSLKWPQ